MQEDFEQFAGQLIKDLNMPRLDQHRDLKNRIDKYYSPRQRFNRWRDSDEGKSWKQRQFESIGAVCPECQIKFPTVYCFEVDHIKPLSQYPVFATEISNLQLLCSKCNLSKGSTNC